MTALSMSSGHLAFCDPSLFLSLGVNKKAPWKVSASNGLKAIGLFDFPKCTEPEGGDLTLDTQGCPGLSFP